MDPQTVVLKQTINLPTTAFSMKANLPQAEPKMLARWEQERLYHKIRASRAGRPVYVLHDGPPYANGRIHLGTAFNKILKDFVVKSKTMAGFDSPYVPGWDCHGLPIEIKVDSELGSKKAQMTAVQIRRSLPRKYGKYVDIQRQDFKRLRVGALGRSVSHDEREVSVCDRRRVRGFRSRLRVQGPEAVSTAYQGRTALAEAEVEYADHNSPSIWVRFALASDPAAIDPALAGRKVYADRTYAVDHPEYGDRSQPRSSSTLAVEVADDVYLVAADLVKVTAEKLGWSEYQTIATFQGARIEGAVFRHPLLERESQGILADHVTLEQGTGAVHTAPGHGQEDYAIGQKYGIATYCPVDAAGRFFRAEGAPGYLPTS
jgi:isoleucyl-tRNA synthetase